MPFSLKLMEVGKLVIVGLTAGSAIVLSEVFEQGLSKIPGFTYEIPYLGSLANILGMFLGALVSGLIGALALNLIDKSISKKLKRLNEEQQISKANEILKTQSTLTEVVKEQVETDRNNSLTNIHERHIDASVVLRSSLEQIGSNSKEIDRRLADKTEIVNDKPVKSENKDRLDNLLNDLDNL